MADEEDSPGAFRRVYRTVTPEFESHRDTEMSSVGWVVILVLVAVLFPLLPLLVVVWLVTKLLDYLAARRGRSTE